MPRRKRPISPNPSTPHKRRITTHQELYYDSLADDLDYLNNRIEAVFDAEALSISRIQKTLHLGNDAPLEELMRLVRDAVDEASDALEEVDGSAPKIVSLMKEVRKNVRAVERSYNPIAWKDLLGCLWQLGGAREELQESAEPDGLQEEGPQPRLRVAGPVTGPQRVGPDESPHVETQDGNGSVESSTVSQPAGFDSSSGVDVETNGGIVSSPPAPQHTATTSSSDFEPKANLGIPSSPPILHYRDGDLSSDTKVPTTDQVGELDTDTVTKHKVKMEETTDGSSIDIEQAQKPSIALAATPGQRARSSVSDTLDYDASMNRAKSNITFSSSSGKPIKRYHTSRYTFYDGYCPGFTIVDMPKTTVESRAAMPSYATSGEEGVSQNRRVLKLERGVVSRV